MRKIAYLLFTVSIFLGSCVFDDIDDSDNIWTLYELFYDANEDKTYARATFREGGSIGVIIDLEANSEVRFEGKKLDLIALDGYYEYGMNGKVDSGSFMFTNVNGDRFTNVIQWFEIDYPANLDTIDRNMDFEFIWLGDGLGNNQYVTVAMDVNTPADQKVFFENGLAADRITLDKTTLLTVSAGSNPIWLDRVYEPSVINGTGVGGRIFGRYRPVNAMPYLK